MDHILFDFYPLADIYINIFKSGARRLQTSASAKEHSSSFIRQFTAGLLEPNCGRRYSALCTIVRSGQSCMRYVEANDGHPYIQFTIIQYSVHGLRIILAARPRAFWPYDRSGLQHPHALLRSCAAGARMCTAASTPTRLTAPWMAACARAFRQLWQPWSTPLWLPGRPFSSHWTALSEWQSTTAAAG